MTLGTLTQFLGYGRPIKRGQILQIFESYRWSIFQNIEIISFYHIFHLVL